MTGEGREYGRRKREGSDEDEETDRIVREIIDEIRREQESEESSEPNELPEQAYDAEKVVREAIEEIQQEEAERLRLEGQKESKEEPQETKEKGEISEEWDVDECVREVIEEVQQEEAERLRTQEEREHAEMETEQQLEASSESRKETADKDEFVELEERILEGFDEYGIDPEEVKEHWRKKFEEEVQDELGEKSRKESEGENDEAAGQEKSAESHYYYDDGSGQIYEIQLDSKERSGSEIESCNEVQEVQEEPPSEQYETSESKKISGENELENVTPIQETKDVVGERTRKGEGLEQEESTKINSEEDKQANEKTTKESVDEFSEEPAPEEKKEKSISTPETDTNRTDEHMESEGSQDTEENIEKDSESREEEIWNNYERKHESLEDEAYKRYLREVMDQLPEDERERFREYVREQVQTIEDFEELARKHGLDELLEDDEVMEEVRKYLKLRQALEDNPDSDLEQLAEEMGIDIDLARDWSRGESEPYSLKKLLNLEAFYLWDEVIRSYREQNQPRSREELENAIESDTELRADRFYRLELDDAIAFVEIMAMRRRGEIERKIRNGREVYSRKQIMELSKKYSISAQEIIAWLRGERVASLIRKIGKNSLKKEGTNSAIIEHSGETKSVPWKIDTMNQFQIALNYHNELRLWETFDSQYENVQNYFNGKLRRKPKILVKIESLELKRSYELAKGGPLRIPIETKQDIEKLQSKYEKLSSKDWEICVKYLEISNNWTMTEEELSSLYGISKAMVYRWRNHFEPPPIAKLRQYEVERIHREWAKLREFQSVSESAHLTSQIDLYSTPKQHHTGIHIEQRVKIIQGLREKSNVPKNTDIIVGFDSDRTYIWEKPTRLDLIYLYKDSFFYFTDKNKLAQFVMNIKQTQNLDKSSKGLHGTLQHLNKILSQMFPQKRSKTYISVRYNQIKGEHLRFLINLSTWSITDLEQSISKIAVISEPKGITNPRFPQGSELETVLTRIVSIVISDSNLKSNGTITYHEPDLRRILIVEKYLQALGDIQLKPTYDKRTNHYVTVIPAVIGKVLLRLGLTPGNKTIHNPGMFPSIFTFSWDALCALFEELIPQDGSVKPTRIDLGHSHTLHPGFKETYKKMKPLISQEEVDFVKEQGVPYKHYKRLALGKLEKFTNDKNSRIARIASKLKNHIFDNPNNFVEYEAKIASMLGVKIIKTPQSIFYHKRTGTVTVSWSLRTENKIEALRLAVIAPPNDVRKRRVMRKSILDNPDIVNKILSEYTERGIEIRRWWNTEDVNGGPGET